MELEPAACPECRRLIAAYHAAVDALGLAANEDREAAKNGIREARNALAAHVKVEAAAGLGRDLLKDEPQLPSRSAGPISYILIRHLP